MVRGCDFLFKFKISKSGCNLDRVKRNMETVMSNCKKRGYITVSNVIDIFIKNGLCSIEPFNNSLDRETYSEYGWTSKLAEHECYDIDEDIFIDHIVIFMPTPHSIVEDMHKRALVVLYDTIDDYLSNLVNDCLIEENSICDISKDLSNIITSKIDISLKGDIKNE